MQRINYTSASYETIVLEFPRDLDTDCVPPPKIIICRRDHNGQYALGIELRDVGKPDGPTGRSVRILDP